MYEIADVSLPDNAPTIKVRDHTEAPDADSRALVLIVEQHGGIAYCGKYAVRKINLRATRPAYLYPERHISQYFSGGRKMSKKMFGKVTDVRIHMTPSMKGMLVFLTIATGLDIPFVERRLIYKQVDALLPVDVLMYKSEVVEPHLIDTMISILRRMLEGRLVHWGNETDECYLKGWAEIKFSPECAGVT
jgi:hypothetical protein